LEDTTHITTGIGRRRTEETLTSLKGEVRFFDFAFCGILGRKKIELMQWTKLKVTYDIW
jgi:hypothetical protein